MSQNENSILLETAKELKIIFRLIKIVELDQVFIKEENVT
jgi:hypothetical protein